MRRDRTRQFRPRPNSVSAFCFLCCRNDLLARRRSLSTSRVPPKAVIVGEPAETAAGAPLEQTARRLAGIRTIPDRLVSSADPDARPIRKGKPQHPR
ncbi:hypothetical protein GCM10014715_45370 [Streptomyces spiralis]|uniref:Uncharacterized protein n=1 Tax=Streptomyces spiralis TaxID=66376 RepID=A0A919A2D2_9ACTN|nr:hypothetical protein GCM10014715_45370 [Streptomyces spiralis]